MPFKDGNYIFSSSGKEVVIKVEGGEVYLKSGNFPHFTKTADFFSIENWKELENA